MQTLMSWLRRSSVSMVVVLTAVLAGVVVAGVAKAGPASASTAPAATPGSGTLVRVPTESAQLYVTPNGRYVWALSHATGTATVIDLNTDKIVGTVNGLWGDLYLAFDASGKYAYVPDIGTGTVTQVDVATLKIVKQLPLGTPLDSLGALAVRSTSKGDQLWVTASDQNYVYVLDVATGAKRKVVVGDQAMTATLAGDQLVLSYANTDRVAIVDTDTDKVDVMHNPTEASGQAAGPIGPHTVALSAFGFTVWLDTATHKFSPVTVRTSDPGNLQGVTAADHGRYTLTGVSDFPQDPFPRNGTIQVIDNDGYQQRRIVEIGLNPWSIVAGSGKVAVVQDVSGGLSNAVRIMSLQPMLTPASLHLSTTHARAGATVHATVAGFDPTEKVVATMHSKPVHLATATVADATTAAFAFKVPKGLPSGKHTVAVTGTWSGLTAHVTVVIDAPKHATAPTHATEPTHHKSAAAGNDAVTPLANTGSHTAPLLATGALLVLLGAGLAFVGRRRYVSRHR